MPPTILSLDWETRSTLDLKAVGLWNYVRGAHTDIWCGAYAFGDEEPQLWVPGQPCPARIVEHVAEGGVMAAWNAPFEITFWQEVATKKYGWPEIRPDMFFCSMSQAYAMGLPGGLEDAALALGLPVLKDTEGRQIMLRMARERRMEDGKPVWWTDDEKLKRLYAYCAQDVRVEQAIRARLLPLSAHERKIWLMDYAINQRGVAVDIPTAKAGAKMAAEVQVRAGQQLAVITEGAVTEATALTALKQWMEPKVGSPVVSLDKEMVEAWLSRDNLPADVRQALVLRQEAGKASVAKLDRMISLAGADGRLHNTLQYHGAAPGRWAARGVQVHNLVRDMPPADVVEQILADVRDGALEWIGMAYGPPMQQISRCLRSFFVAAPGKVLIAGDFAGVESRGGAWMAGESWKLRAFREADAKTGPGVYELTASKTLGIPVASIGKDSPERQMGKVQELAFQYQGGVAAARKFLPKSLKDTPDKTLNQWKFAWRDTHKMIVRFWKELEEAAINAVRSEGQVFEAGFPGRGVKFKKAGSFLWCQLPSGRVMCMPYPKLLAGTYKDELTYMVVPNEGAGTKIIADVKNANNWARVSTYGGSLMQTMMEAICRDLLADKMLELHEKGAAIVLHVHDEVIVEVPEAKAPGARMAMEATMRAAPAWAEGFPLHADCHIQKRYGK
jgi:DNA polymerase